MTGANGFIGRHLCRHLSAQGFQVRGTVRAGTDGARQPIEYRSSGNIDEHTDWRPLLVGVDAVVHAAARVHVLRESETDPLATFRKVNVAGTQRLARQAADARVRRFVLLSSIKAREAERAAPGAPGLDPYQISKWEAEVALARAARDSGMETVVLRPPLVYGPGAAANFALLVRAVARGLPLPLARVRNRRSFLYVGNLCSAIEACLTHPAAAGGVFEVSDGPPISTPDFVRRIGAALGRPARLLPCPPGLLRLAGRLLGRSATVERLTGDLVADDRELRERLGWRPPTDMAAALAETVAAPPDGASSALRAPVTYT
ncbi:MAG: NAD-dependent epimerase/dehydratase family protein [Kiloniellaceae bacterium]